MADKEPKGIAVNDHHSTMTQLIQPEPQTVVVSSSSQRSAISAVYRDFESRMDLLDEKLPALELVHRAVNEKIGRFTTKSEIMERVSSIG